MPTTDSTADRPQKLRLQLAHALVQHVTEERSVDLLHINGCATDPGLYQERGGLPRL